MKKNIILTTIAGLLISGIILGNRHRVILNTTSDRVLAVHRNDTVKDGLRKALPKDTTQTDDTNEGRGGDVSDGGEPSVSLPNMPETEGFAPTMMSDIEPANPASKINIIAPPSANNHGTASLSYAFEMPPARNGMAPQLGLQYSSDGGSGFCGEGWDLPIPSITVDTRWGVPRYDPDNETETYLLNGEMLCFKTDDSLTTAHRTPNVPRTEYRRFYTRRGGDFSRIVRMGDSLSNYYWEVTDNNGTVYTYGSSNHTDGHLKGTFTDATGSQRTVTAEWKLTKVQEIHGDHCDYSYATFNDTVSGSLTAKEIYPSSVNVYRAENNTPYITVNFISDASHTKNMRRSNARYGFLTSSNRLLQRVDILFRDTLLRSYPLTYINGAYNKKLLSKVTHKDNHGNDVSFNQFTYHNSNIGNTLPFKSSPNKTLNTSPDDAGFPVSVGGLDDEATAIGGSKTKGMGGGVYAGVGTFDANGTKKYSAGMSVSYNQSTTKGLTTLVDINGDGLADRLFVKNNMLKVNLQNINGNFGTAQQIEIPIRDFLKTSTSAYGGGTQGYLSPAQAGLDHSLSKSKTTTYLADVNGDGLVDIVSGETVYFNTTKPGDAVPSFSTDSHATGVPYDGGGTVQFSNTYDAQERDSLLKYSPMVDAVRVWTAPIGGNISISGSVRRLLPTVEEASSAEYKDADVMKTSIQYQNVIKWSKIIQKGDGASYSANSSFHVSAGEKVFFRVQSGTNQLSNGSFDKVVWEPEIRYTGYDFQAVDTLNYSPADYQNAVYKTSQAVSWSQDTPVPVSGTTATIHGSISQTVALSEAVKLRVVRLNSYGQQMSHTDFGVTSVINQTVSLNGASFIRLEFFSEGNVQWEKLRPRLQITCAGNTFNAPVKYLCYNRQYKAGGCYKREHALLFPKIHFSSQIESDSVHMVVKTFSNLLVHASTYAIQNTDYFNHDNTYYVPISGDSVIVEYYFKNPTTAGKVQHALFYMADNAADVPTSWNEIMTDDSLSVMQTGDEADRTSHADDSSNSAGDANMRTGNWYASVYSRVEPTAVSPDYRGWSLISYIPDAAGYNGPINLSRLVPPTAQSNVMFHPLCIMRQDSVTVPAFGHSRNVWVHGDTLCAGRLSVPEVRAVNPLASLNGSHSEAFGIPLVTKNSSTDIMGGAGAAFFSMSGNVATGNSKTTTAFMDMNGDGYPDILGDGHIQYTGPLGSYGNDKASLSMEGVQSAASISRANTAGGQAVHAFIRKGHPENGAERTAKIAGNLSTTGGSSDDTSEWEYIDLNGDGLPDLLNFQNGKAKYNLGYAFTVETTVSNLSPTTMHGYDATVSIGGSFDYGLSSFAGGTAGAKTTNYSKCEYIDLNGDGLPDKVTYDNNTNTAKVFLNTGAGFSTTVINLGSALFQENATQSESVNMAYTLSIPITGTKQRVVMNPSVHTSWSANATKKAIRDIDGDGCPDILTSSSPTSLTVKRSDIGCTNMLQTVTNSLGGKFTIEYSRTSASCDHPGGKWAMSTLTIDDGIHDDGPNQRQTFTYADGKYDRPEREFLGFGTVTTSDINTALSDTSIYRKHVEEYDVSDWYAQGNLLSSSVQDPGGTKLSETTYTYYRYKAVPETNNTAIRNSGMALTESQAGSGCAMFAPLRFIERKLDNVVVEQTHYTYITEESHGEVETIKYSDKGTLSASGSGTFDRRTVYEYDNLFSQNYHVFCQPTDITIYNSSGTPLASTGYEYVHRYPTDVEEVTQYLSADWHRQAITTYEYDSYTHEGVTKSHGNVTKITLPAGVDGHSQTYDYAYETDLNTYVTEIRDAFNDYVHFYDYDYRYGIAQKKKDVNNSLYYTIIDDIGRLVSVTSPNEIGTEDNKSATVEYSYSPMATVSNGSISSPAHAVTTMHIRNGYSVGEDNIVDSSDVRTYSFVDGFGRVVQTRKNGYIMTNTNSGTRSNKTIVSGRVNYDAFGRLRTENQPYDTTYPISSFRMNDTVAIKPTYLSYDELDRPTSVKLPDNATTSYTYSMSSHLLKTETKDAIRNVVDTYTSGAGLTMREVRHLNNQSYSTNYLYDGLGRPIRVTDALSNKTYLSYDMAGHTLSVDHPASGLTTYTYDNAGNKTSQTNADGLTTNYTYDRGRLMSVAIPDHPENNVSYVYGNGSENHNAAGRVVLRIDGSGATEFWYDAMGNVSKTLRSIVVPYYNRTASFATEWNYNSYGQLLCVSYPDDEEVFYRYDRCGQLDRVYRDGYDPYYYVSLMGYDRMGRRTYMRQGNNAVTTYSYSSYRKWLTQLYVKDGAGTPLMRNYYSYDQVGNIKRLYNSNDNFSHSFTYDKWSRLTDSEMSHGTSEYFKTSMTHDVLYRVKKKTATMWRMENGVRRYAGDSLHYTYPLSGSKYRCSSVSESHYSTASSSLEPIISETHSLSYDANGNMIRALSTLSDMRYVWDTQNRLLAASSNGYVSTYLYDGEGQRALKQYGGNEAVYTNSAEAAVRTEASHYSLYANPYFVMSDGERYTKHVYIGSERIAVRVAKLGANSSYVGNFENEVHAGNGLLSQDLSYSQLRQAQEGVIAACYYSLGYSYIPMNHRDAKDIVMIPTGGKDTQRRGANTNIEWQCVYYYCTDHIGSTRLVLDDSARIAERLMFLPTGEVFMDDQNSTLYHSDFLFSGKELDAETGNYYFGARYLAPRLGIWLSPDPMQLKYPHVSSYAYCMGNPVNRIDPEGKDGVLVFDHENNVIVVKANYYVQTVGRPSIYGNNLGYTPSDIKYLNNQINGYLNNLNLKVEDGVYCNYSIKFELSFISGGNQIDVANKASEDFYEGVHIGNTFSKWDTTFKLFIPSSENGVDNVVGGVTNHKNEIIMNYLYDGKMNRVHEVFHTLGFDDFSHGEKNHGIMSYPPRKPDQSDVNRLVYGGFLPMLHK